MKWSSLPRINCVYVPQINFFKFFFLSVRGKEQGYSQKSTLCSANKLSGIFSLSVRNRNVPSLFYELREIEMTLSHDVLSYILNVRASVCERKETRKLL